LGDHRRAALLRASVGIPTEDRPSADDWDGWMWAARMERLIPQLYALACAGRLGLADEQFRQAEAMQLDVASLCLRLEHALIDVAALFDGAGVRFAVLKGGATCHLDYEDPSQRQFGDIDVLIDPVDMDRARLLLEREGWAQAYPLPRHHKRFAHAVTFKTAGIAELDLHQRIAHRALGLLAPSDELLRRRISFEIAGRPLWALSDVDRLIHASLHALASRGPYRRLSSVADVLVLSDRLLALSEEVLEQAESWSLRPLVQAAIEDAHAEARLELPDAWRSAIRAPLGRRNRLVERAYLAEQRRPVVEEVAHLLLLDGWGDRFRYLTGYFHLEDGTASTSLSSRLRYLLSRLRRRA